MWPRTICVFLALGSAGISCGGSDTVDSTNFLAGTYVASIFTLTPLGQAPLNVLAAGGSLRITIKTSGSTTGTLNLPASVTGGAPFTASMAGTATITALTVQFEQSIDTFVRDLTWARVGSLLSVVDQAVGNTTYTITLIRE